MAPRGTQSSGRVRTTTVGTATLACREISRLNSLEQGPCIWISPHAGKFDRSSSTQLQTLANDVMASGRPATWIDPVSGINFEIRPTGWTDANGVWGYINPPSAGTVQTARLGAREQASKEYREVVITP